MGFKFEGLDEFRDAFDHLRSRGKQTARDALREHMEQVVKAEADVLVPKLTEALLNSATVFPGTAEISYSLKYGNSPVNNKSPGVVDYAAAVHELDATHEPPTTYKFLSKPLEDTMDQIGPRVGQKLNELLEE
jgi:hypothetical protein